MKLNESQAIETLKTPNNSKCINEIKKYESALRVYTEELDEEEIKKEEYWKTLTEKIKNRSVKKFGRITQFMRFPLPIVQATDAILNDFFKVFEGKNRYFNLSTDREATALKDWINEVNPQKWIEDNARKVFKNKPSTIVVLDRDDSGKPYLLTIDSKRLIDISLKDDGQAEYVSFIHSIVKDTSGTETINYSVYDDEFYRVYQSVKDSGIYTLTTIIPHNLKYCPARAFIGTSSNDKNPLKRRVAFGSSLSKLEDWTIFDIFRNYVDHYVPFPVIETPVVKCKNPKCKNGKERKLVNVGNGEKKEVFTDCKTCKSKNDGSLIGPGSMIKVHLQAEKNKEDGSGKFKMHFPETDKMDYIPKKLDTIEREIRYKTVGISNLLSKEAVNELQVKGSFASMETILMRNKTELDNLYKWIVKTVSDLYYINLSVKIDANFGTEFYLMSEEQLQKLFKEAKEIGLPREEIKSIYEQLISTKYKGNQEKVLRHKMLMDLDNYAFYTEKECIELNTTGVLDTFDLSLKVNFVRFIGRFERENLPITDFGKNLEYSETINTISQELEKYNEELISSQNGRIINLNNNNNEPIIESQQGGASV